MINKEKTKEELINELTELKQEFNSIKDLYEKDIIERKQVEDKLSRLVMLLDLASCVIAVNDTQGKYIYANQKALDLHGYTREEFMSLKVQQMDDPESKELFESRIKALSERGEVIFQTSHFRKDGSILPLEVFAKYTTWNNKNVILSVATDITERIQAEKELLKAKDYAELNNANITAIIEGTKESIWAFNKNYDILYLNKTFQIEFQKTFGIWLEIGSKLIESHPGTIRAKWKTRYDRVLNNEQFTVEDVVDNENGKIYIQVAFTPIIKKGEVIGGSCIGSDITNRKLAEQELIQAKEKAEESAEKLKKSEKQLKLKLDYILTPDNTMGNISLTDVVDLDLLQKIQDSFVKATGVASVITDMDGKPITQPSNFSSVCKMIRNTEKGRVNCYKSDKMIGLKAGQDKKPFFVECFSCGFIDAGAPIIVAGKQLGIWMIGQSNVGKVDIDRIRNYALEIGIDPELLLSEYSLMGNMSIQQFENVTSFLWLMAQEISNLAFSNIQLTKNLEELKKYKSDLVIAKEKAEESDRLKSAFLANMSHEIRTPMNGILGFADLLREPNLSVEVQNNYISIIEKSGKRMLNIINDIVDISKIEAGLMKLDINESNINEQIDYVYTFFKPEAEAKSINLIYNNTLTAKDTIFYTDREKVYAILTNLVKNAIKYTEKGKIEIGCYKKSENFEIYVKDTGIGIPKDQQQAIFERFIQVDIEDRKVRQGAGLGLAISKAYIEMIGGKMWVDSQEGIGSCFYFTLPFNIETKEESAEVNIFQTEKDLNYNNPQIPGLKILIVEDDEISGLLLNLEIKQFCKEILKVSNGTEAIEICRNNKDLDLVLMDIQLPGINGYEACRQIRQFNQDVIIIAQTAYGLAGDREKAIEAGCNEYISKPINQANLKMMILNYFGDKFS